MKEEEAEALFYKDLVKRAATERERALLLDHVAELAETRHNAAKTATERQAALRFSDTVRGKITPTLHHVEEWLAGLRDKPATVQAKRRVVEQFAEAFPILQEVETRAVQTWLTERTRKEDLAAPTVDRLIGFPRAY